MAETAAATPAAAPSPSPASPRRRRFFSFRRRANNAPKRAKKKGKSMRYRNMYRNFRARRGARRGVVSTMRGQGKGMVRYGKVALLWTVGGIAASVVDTLLARAGLDDTPIGRFLIEVGAGAMCIILGGPALGAFGSGMILGAGGNLLYAEIKSLQTTGKLDA